MSDTAYQKALGRKIAEHRRRRGLSQHEFARLIDRSVAWVSWVERGVREVGRMPVLEKVAEVLDVPLSELAVEEPPVVAAGERTSGAAGLRLVLSGAHALRATLYTLPVPAISQAKAQVGKAWELVHDGRYVELTGLLRDLVPALEIAVRSAPDGRRAELAQLLAEAYQACSAALVDLADPEAAWIAAERAIGAAERAGGPIPMAAGAFRLGSVFLAARHCDQAEENARTAVDALWSMAEGGCPEAMSLCGGLTLQRAVAASRTGRAEAAYDHLAHARRIAERLGEGRNDHGTRFGPAAVTLHEIAVAVELGDAERALRVAATVDPSRLPAEQRARMLADVARAHAVQVGA